MRFLCLHGRGTNSKVFEIQTSAIRYELADQHDYDFVEGTIPWDVDPDLKDLLAGDEETFAFVDERNPATVLAALESLQSFVEAEGPYDGVLAFSQAVGVAATWMLAQATTREPSFKCAIFIAGAAPAADVPALRQGRFEWFISDAKKPSINVPTAHIWGEKDPWKAAAESVYGLCSPDSRSLFIHSGGHEVPGSGSKESVTQTVNAIRRAVLLAHAAA